MPTTLDKLHAEKAALTQQLDALHRKQRRLVHKERTLKKAAQKAQWEQAGQVCAELGLPVDDLGALRSLLAAVVQAGKTA